MTERVVEGEFTEVQAPQTALAVRRSRDRDLVAARTPRDVVPRDHDGQLWDRAMGESSFAFAWFELYRGLGPERSAIKAYNAWRKQQGQPPSPSGKLPGQWVRVSLKWSWRLRAEAFDQHEIDVDRHEESEARKKDREQRITAAKALRGKAAQALQQLNAADFSVGDVIQAIKVANAETRTEYDDGTDKKAGQEAEQMPVKVFVSISPAEL